MREQRRESVQRAHHDVKRHPDDKQPACPVVALEQKRTANDRSDPGEIDHPVAFKVCEAIGCIDQLHQGMDQRDGSEQDEQYSNDDDRWGALFHADETNACVFVCKASRRHPKPAGPRRHHQQTRTTSESHLSQSSFDSNRWAVVVRSPGMPALQR